MNKYVSPLNFLYHFRSIFTIPQGPSYLRFLDSFRVFSMLWVQLGHVLVFYLGFLPAMHAYTNVENLRDSFPHHFLLAGTFAPDTFFFLSGLLASYQVSKALIKLGTFKQRFIAVINICLQRYVRLIGLVLFVLFLIMIQNPAWTRDPFQQQMIRVGKEGKFGGCRRYWWTVPLLMTNISEGAAECCVWIWYISNDWQFFIVGMTLVLIYVWNRKAGIISSVSILTLSLLVSVYVVMKYRFSASVDVFGFSALESVRRDMREMLTILHELPHSDYFYRFYVNPIVRIQSYVIGFMFGLYVEKKESEGDFITRESVICQPSRTESLTNKVRRSKETFFPSSLSAVYDFSLTRPRNVSLTRDLDFSPILDKSDTNESIYDKKSSSQNSVFHEGSSLIKRRTKSFLNRNDSYMQNAVVRSTSLPSSFPNSPPCGIVRSKSQCHNIRSLTVSTATATSHMSVQSIYETSMAIKLVECKLYWACEVTVYLALIGLICLPYFANTKHVLWIPLVDVLYVAWSRCVWSICIGALCFLSLSNNLKINPFLSSNLWIPFSKLSYSFYLMHPIVLSRVYFANRLNLPHFLSWYTFGFYFLLTLFISLIVSILSYVFIEMPLKLLGYRILMNILYSLKFAINENQKVD